MNQTEFEEICEATALALHIEPSPNDGEYHFLIDNVEVLLIFDEKQDDDAIFCYVNLGEPHPGDRAQVCEQLLQLNLYMRGCPDHFYAFDTSAGRAIFCARLADADEVDGEYVAHMLRRYIEQTEAARQIVVSPLSHAEELRSDKDGLSLAALV